MTEDRSPRLIWTEDGAPASGRFGDVYYSKEDGLAESRAVFLAGCGMPGAWAERPRFTVAELGFGTGLNVAALIDLWLKTRPVGGRLHIFTVEGFPLSSSEAERALGAWPELSDVAQALIAAWPARTPGFHRFDLPPGWAVTLDLAVAPVEAALSEWIGAADAWFLDGFAPSTNPDMWSEDVLDLVTARSAPGARLATFTVAGAVRRGLQARGFTVDKRPGHGRKRERLEARGPGVADSASPVRRVAVVGGGVAGMAVAKAVAALGAAPVLIEADDLGSKASGFPTALVTPRLDVGDADLAALFAQALRRAGDVYGVIDGAISARGVIQLEQGPRDAVRFDRIAVQEIWPTGGMVRLDPAETRRRVGEPVDTGALFMADALAVRPAAIIAAWRTGLEIVPMRAIGVEVHANAVDVLGDDDRVVKADAVVLTAGWGLDALAPELGLRPVRGQADWVGGAEAPAVAWGGYLAPGADGLMYGATHDRGRTDTEIDPADTARNLKTVEARLPRLADRIGSVDVRLARAAVRATTPDRLPIAGRLRHGVYVLGGLGSRGFVLSPLLAEHVAALIVGAPSPLPRAPAERLSPARLAERRGAPLR